MKQTTKPRKILLSVSGMSPQYDAYFLQSALSNNYRLFTLDSRMKEVAKKLGIILLE